MQRPHVQARSAIATLTPHPGQPSGVRYCLLSGVLWWRHFAVWQECQLHDSPRENLTVHANSYRMYSFTLAILSPPYVQGCGQQRRKVAIQGPLGRVSAGVKGLHQSLRFYVFRDYLCAILDTCYRQACCYLRSFLPCIILLTFCLAPTMHVLQDPIL